MTKQLSLLAVLMLVVSASIAADTTETTAPQQPQFAPHPFPAYAPVPADYEAQKKAFDAQRTAMQAHADDMRAQHDAFFKAQREYHESMMEAQKKAAEAHFAMVKQMYGIEQPQAQQ